MESEGDALCPYCGRMVEICHDDGFGQIPERDYKYLCHHCGEWFKFSVEYYIYYTTRELHG